MAALHDSISETDDRDISKVRLLNALAELLKEEPMRSISVSDICARAGVSRQTFYRHFENKFAIAQWYWLQLAQRTTMRVGRDLTWHESLSRGYESQGEQREISRFFVETAREGAYESSRAFGMRTRIESLHETITDYVGVPLTEKLEFQVRFFSIAESQLMEEVFTQTPEYDAGRISDLMESCVPTELHDLLDEHVLAMRAEEGGTAE